MLIDLKLTADQLNYLDKKFQSIMPDSPLVNQTHEFKVIVSICIDVADKFYSKYKSISRKSSLFEIKKKYKMTFKYHEAHAINVFLQGARNKETDPYNIAIVQKLSLMFDQKLT